MNEEDTPKKNMKTTWLVVGLVALMVVVLAAWQVLRTNPERTLNTFLTAIEEGDRGTAMSLVSDDILTEKRENIAWFVDDWTGADKVTQEVTLEEAWRQRVTTETNDQGEEVNKLNEYGDRDKEIEPAPRYFAGYYHAEVTVNYDEDEDPVIITLRRKSDDRWSRLSTTFRGWEIVRIQYQPLSEEELEQLESLEEDFFEFDGEAEEIDFDIDEDGNLILPDNQGVILEEEGAQDEEAVDGEASDGQKKSEDSGGANADATGDQKANANQNN